MKMHSGIAVRGDRRREIKNFKGFRVSGDARSALLDAQVGQRAELFAMRRDIRVGRRNNRYVEVREGLRQGERVITSSYGQMADMERIQLTQ